MTRVHQASKLAAGRTLCGRELAKLSSGARVLAGDVAEADVTCSVCRRHRRWEERTLAELPRARARRQSLQDRPFLPPCSRCGAAADVDRTPTGKACRICGRVAAASPDVELERGGHTCSLGGGTDLFCKACDRSAPIAPSDLQAPDLELGFRASSSPAPGAMDRAIGATRSSDALYRRAVEHIEKNATTGFELLGEALALQQLRQLSTVELVADVWGSSVDEVARYVLRMRSFKPFSG